MFSLIQRNNAFTAEFTAINSLLSLIINHQTKGIGFVPGHILSADQHQLYFHLLVLMKACLFYNSINYVSTFRMI